MRLLTALEIATNYETNDLLVSATQHKETLKWGSFLYLLRNGEIHKLMLSFDINEKFEGFDSEEEAKLKMEELVEAAITYCKEQGYKF